MQEILQIPNHTMHLPYINRWNTFEREKEEEIEHKLHETTMCGPNLWCGDEWQNWLN